MNYWNVYMGKHRMQMNVCIVLFGASAQKKHFFPEKRLKLLTSAVSQFNMGCEASERVKEHASGIKVTSPKKINI